MVRRGRPTSRGTALAASEDIDNTGNNNQQNGGAVDDSLADPTQQTGKSSFLGRLTPFRSKSRGRSKSIPRGGGGGGAGGGVLGELDGTSPVKSPLRMGRTKSWGRVKLTDDEDDEDDALERRIALSKSNGGNDTGGEDAAAFAAARGATAAAASARGTRRTKAKTPKKNRWPSIGRSRSRTKAKHNSAIPQDVSADPFDPYDLHSAGQNGDVGGGGKGAGGGRVEEIARAAAALAEANAAHARPRPAGQAQYDDDAGGAWTPQSDINTNFNAAATADGGIPPPSAEEALAIRHSVKRTLSREDVKAQGTMLAQMQARAQMEERRSRSRSRERSGTGTGRGGGDGASSTGSVVTDEDVEEDIDLGKTIDMNGRTSSAGNRLSSAARRAADAAASLARGGAAGGGGGGGHSRDRSKVRFLDPTTADGGVDAEDLFLASSNQKRTPAEAQEIAAIRAVLNRPPGRRDLLPPMAQRYRVKVAPAAFDNVARTYKYSTTVIGGEDDSAAGGVGGGGSSLPPAKTARSLTDFLFLDTYLRTEFAGASLPPLLSVALYGRELLGVKGPDDDGEGSVTTASTFGTLQPNGPVRTISDLARRCQERLEKDMDNNVPVHEGKLATWLGDVLNGIRGDGEWLLLPRHHQSGAASYGVEPIDVASSEALEAFLYRNTDSLPAPPVGGLVGYDGDGSRAGGSRTSCLAIAMNPPDSPSDSNERKRYTALEVLLARPLACLDQRCGGQWDDMHNSMNDVKGKGGRPSVVTTPSKRGAVVLDGLPPNASPSRIAQGIGFTSPLLTAQRDVLTTYRRHATKTVHRLKILQADELRMSTAWKRFAISLSNLFAFEKDLENASVFNVSKTKLKEERKKKPYRKISKNMVDDGLRVMAKRKVERSGPGLDCVADMMANYLTDLAAVDPCLVEYGRAVQILDDPVRKLLDSAGCAGVEGGAAWKQGSVKAVAALKSATSSLANKSVQAPPSPPSDNSPGSVSSQHKPERLRVAHQGQVLESALTALCQSASIRSSRTASQYLRAEASRAANLRSGAMTLRAKLQVSAETKAEIAERDSCHSKEEKEDDVFELGVVRRVFELVQSLVSNDDEDSVAEEKRQAHEESCSRALLLAYVRVGRWNGELALALMECSGVEDAQVRVEETTRDLRLVRKYAIGLRKNVERCAEAVGMLNGVVLGADSGAHGGDDQSLDASIRSTHSNVSSSTSYEAMKINRKRELFLASMARSLSGTTVPGDADELQRRKAEKSAQVLEGADVNLSDPPGWLAASEIIESGQQRHRRVGRCGELLVSYQRVRDADVAVLLARINQLLADYHKRVEMIESFVYMHCVGIQLEKHYSKLRSEALADWEQKTDITTAINIATKKHLPGLVEELTAKLESLPPTISHTSVKKAKEKHLLSKSVKEDLQKLAERRFLRAREASTERVITMMKMWAQHEEEVAHNELKSLGELINETEKHITRETIECDGGAHLLAVATAAANSAR